VLAQASAFRCYRRIKQQIISGRSKNKMNALDKAALSTSREQTVPEKNLLIVKMREDLMSILTISMVYTCGSLLSGSVVINATVQNWDIYRDERYFTIVFMNLPNIVETFSSVYLCLNINPINAAMRYAANRVLKCMLCCQCRAD